MRLIYMYILYLSLSLTHTLGFLLRIPSLT